MNASYHQAPPRVDLADPSLNGFREIAKEHLSRILPLEPRFIPWFMSNHYSPILHLRRRNESPFSGCVEWID